jgi:transcriptional regulator with XRE-family HTH domain
MTLTPLRKERERRNMSATEVAKAVGINQSYYSKIERGFKPAPDIAEKLALFFGHTVTELQILYPERYMLSGEAA